MEYTKGERRLIYRGEGLGYAVEIEDRQIATFHEHLSDHGAGQAKADAQIDIAAPALYEALKETLQLLSGCYRKTTPQGILDARKALAKAEGRK